MIYCTNCGTELEESAKFCYKCGHQVQVKPAESVVITAEAPVAEQFAVPAEEGTVVADVAQKPSAKAKIKGMFAKVLPFVKKYYKIIIAAIVVLAAVLIGVGIYESTHCSYSSCNNANVDGSSYCYTHKCNLCNSPKAYNSNYCYYHKVLQNNTGTSSNSTANATKDLKFSNIKIEHNSLYTVVTGKVTNNGTRTYKFVTIKGSFKDSSGKVIDTDSTYAVGSEGLAKGESKTFRMSVDKNYNIKTCSISITDYS